MESRIWYLSEDGGYSVEISRGITGGMNGVAVVYTNKKSLSVCIGANLADLSQKKIKPYEMLENKYGGFLLENFVWQMSLLNIEFEPLKPNIVLQVGISFYTFQSLSYTLDVYRKSWYRDVIAEQSGRYFRPLRGLPRVARLSPAGQVPI